MDKPEIRVGISQCLLGEEVRFDGGHKHDPFITETLGKYFHWVSVCPEVEVGMGIPRESVQLVDLNGDVRMLGVRSRKDHTDAMMRFSAKRVNQLKKEKLHGFILKRGSPSCGMERVRIYGTSGMPSAKGSGLFAGELLKQFPLMPVEEEGRLHDLRLRENFIERVFAYYRWLQFVDSHPRSGDLVAFHTRQKCTVLSHSTEHYRRLGRMVAEAGRMPLQPLLEEYGRTFMEALKLKATPRKHANVLYHLLGYLKKALDSGDKVEIVECIENYRKGLIPLIVPITLLLHHFRKNPTPWVMDQIYLNPYPSELMLRNHV